MNTVNEIIFWLFRVSFYFCNLALSYLFRQIRHITELSLLINSFTLVLYIHFLRFKNQASLRLLLKSLLEFLC